MLSRRVRVTNRQLKELLKRLGRERREDAMKAYLTLKMEERRN